MHNGFLKLRPVIKALSNKFVICPTRFFLENTPFKAAFNTAEYEQFLYFQRKFSVSCSFRDSRLDLLFGTMVPSALIFPESNFLRKWGWKAIMRFISKVYDFGLHEVFIKFKIFTLKFPVECLSHFLILQLRTHKSRKVKWLLKVTQPPPFMLPHKLS